jgi:hypothetical protein
VASGNISRVKTTCVKGESEDFWDMFSALITQRCL